MSKAPDGYQSPSPEVFNEWCYRTYERIGMACPTSPCDHEEFWRALAAFEADRALEQLHPELELYRGWVKLKAESK